MVHPNFRKNIGLAFCAIHLSFLGIFLRCKPEHRAFLATDRALTNTDPAIPR